MLFTGSFIEKVLDFIVYSGEIVCVWGLFFFFKPISSTDSNYKEVLLRSSCYLRKDFSRTDCDFQ